MQIPITVYFTGPEGYTDNFTFTSIIEGASNCQSPTLSPPVGYVTEHTHIIGFGEESYDVPALTTNPAGCQVEYTSSISPEIASANLLKISTTS